MVVIEVSFHHHYHLRHYQYCYYCHDDPTIEQYDNDCNYCYYYYYCEMVMMNIVHVVYNYCNNNSFYVSTSSTHDWKIYVDFLYYIILFFINRGHTCIYSSYLWNENNTTSIKLFWVYIQYNIFKHSLRWKTYTGWNLFGQKRHFLDMLWSL